MTKKNIVAFIEAFFIFALTLSNTNASSTNQASTDALYNHVLKSAIWAVTELSKLSDSGIYESLKLEHILFFNVTKGLYHKNSNLIMNLSSPHFQSNNAVETFEFIIMQPLISMYEYRFNHPGKRKRIFAIDRFPKMNPKAIELAWIKKVERLRKEREAIIQEFKHESLNENANNSSYKNQCDTVFEHKYQEKQKTIFRVMNDDSIKIYIHNQKDEPGREKEIQAAKYVLNERRIQKDMISHSLKDLTSIMRNENESPARRFAARRLFDQKIISPDFHFDLFG